MGLSVVGYVILAGSPLDAVQRTSSAADWVAARIDGRVMQAHLRFLADDALEGRGPGTRGGTLAAKYVAAQFGRLGLEPLGDSGSYFQRVPLVGMTVESSELIVGGNDTLRFRDEQLLAAVRPEALITLKSEAVFAGYGIVAPAYAWDDYRGLDVRGRIVIVLGGDPGAKDTTVFTGTDSDDYGGRRYKVEEAGRHGAVGVLMIHAPAHARFPWSDLQTFWTEEQGHLPQLSSSVLVAGWVRERAAARLLRVTAAQLSSMIDQASARQRPRPAVSVPVEATVRSRVRFFDSPNVIGGWRGQGALASQAIVIGAHYDHLGIGTPVDGDSIYNGALDNASGTAGLLTLAEAFAGSRRRVSRSIMFTAFTAEEMGLLGSQAFVTWSPVTQDIVAALNLDGLELFGETADISALGMDQSSLGSIFNRAAAAEKLQIVVFDAEIRSRMFFRSDQASFARAGVPALFLRRGLSFRGRSPGWGAERREEFGATRYHTPDDELLEWYTVDGAVQQLRVIIRTAAMIADGSTRPVWSKHSKFARVRRKE